MQCFRTLGLEQIFIQVISLDQGVAGESIGKFFTKSISRNSMHPQSWNRAPDATCWLWLGCWNNNSANSHPSPGAFNGRELRACLVPQCSYPTQRPLANCDWMPASYTSGQPSNRCRHPTCWASWQCSHIVSSTPCHGAWTSAPLSAYLSVECKRTAPKIETPICTRRTTTPVHLATTTHVRRTRRITNGMRSGRTSPQDSAFSSPTPAPTPREPGSGVSVSVPLLLAQMGYGLLCGLWEWRRRTNRRQCCPPMSNPSTSSWTARPDGSGRWNNRMAAQHLPRDLVRSNSGFNN